MLAKSSILVDFSWLYPCQSVGILHFIFCKQVAFIC